MILGLALARSKTGPKPVIFYRLCVTRHFEPYFGPEVDQANLDYYFGPYFGMKNLSFSKVVLWALKSCVLVPKSCVLGPHQGGAVLLCGCAARASLCRPVHKDARGAGTS